MPEPSLTLVVLRSPDIDRLKAFYEALGLALTAERHGNGPDHYSATLGSTIIEFYPGNGQVEKGSQGTCDSVSSWMTSTTCRPRR